jgi:hypothetical protein
MKITVHIARCLLGLIFVVFGLNGFLRFIPTGPMPPGYAGQFLGAILDSHYVAAVCLFQLVGGILFLVNRYIPVALTLTGPIIVNILLFHVFMAPAGIGPGVVVTVLWLLVFYRVRSAFAGIFQSRGI